MKKKKNAFEQCIQKKKKKKKKNEKYFVLRFEKILLEINKSFIELFYLPNSFDGKRANSRDDLVVDARLNLNWALTGRCHLYRVVCTALCFIIIIY